MKTAPQTLALMQAQPLPDAGGAPDWIHLIPAGTDIQTSDHRGPYRVIDPQAVVAAFTGKLPIDENHAIDLAAPRGEASPARGYIVELQARADGIWGRADWTETGRALVADRAYLGISPAVIHDGQKRILAIARASLTNRPNFRGLTSLHHTETSMTPAVAKALGLADDASEDQILGAIGNAMFQKGATRRVARSTFAAVTFETFELECDRNINASKDEARRQMWNRAALKALRIAALLAVAENPFSPVIRQVHADWAINLVMRDIATFTRRLNGGDVGSDDDARVIKLTTLIREYLASPVPASYNVPDAMRQGMIVPRNYLTIRAGRQAAFSGHRLGKVRALEEAIGAMLADGYLMEVQKDRTVDAYSYHGKAYRVIRLPDFGDQS